MVSLFRWYISRSMVSGRVSRQEHGIEKVHPFSTHPRSLGHPWLVRWERSDGGLILILFGIEH